MIGKLKRTLQKVRRPSSGEAASEEQFGPGAEAIDWPKAKLELISLIADRLAGTGLSYQSGLQWSERTALGGVRRLFRVHDAGSGRPLTMNWGYSLDVVPHLSGSTVKFHRTFALARRDLWMLPAVFTAPRAERHYGESYFWAAAAAMIDDALPRATAFWNGRHSLDGVFELMNQADCLPLGEFHRRKGSVYTLARSAFSRPFTMAALGHPASEVELNREVSTYRLTDNVKSDLVVKLHAALEARRTGESDR